MCPYGRPFTLVEGIQGRAEDTLHLPGIAGGEVTIHPSVFHHIMDAIPVSGWQVIQEADASLTVLLSGVRDGLIDDALTTVIEQTLAGRGAGVPHIQVQRVAAIPKTAAGKAPLVKAYRAAIPPHPDTLPLG